MKKYLFISNSNKPSQEKLNSRDKVILSNFSKPCVEAALEMGYKVFMGINRANPHELECDHDVTFYFSSTYRSLFDFKSNYIAFRNLLRLLREEKIDVIHCNTPVGGMVGRICGKVAGVPKVIYTAHGFHFYQGAPRRYAIFRIAEQLMARVTDVIITINEEDYEAAKKFRLRNEGKVYLVHGVGIDTRLYKNVRVDSQNLRKSLGLKADEIVLIAMGDLIKRKNFASAIKAIARTQNKKLKFLICGRGPELPRLQKLAKKLGVEDQVKFLGFRKDIKELLAISDIFLFTSYQEGLPRSLMEAMSAGLPVVVSRIRGNVDLVEHGKGGFLHAPDDYKGLADSINLLATDPSLRKHMGQVNLEKIEDYDVAFVTKQIEKIYNEVLV